MNMSSWSIKNPIPAVLLFILLTLAGVFGFKAMKIQNMPDVDLPIVNVTAALPGASPSQIENEIARKMETSLASLQGVKHITTTLQDGVASISVEFRMEKSIQEAVDEVRDTVSRIRSDMPSEMKDPVVAKSNIAGTPILTYTVESNRLDDVDLSWFVDNEISRSISSIKGVGAVTRVGGVNRQIRVELHPIQMTGLGITAAEVSRQLKLVEQEASGGKTEIGASEQSVRTIATASSAAELGNMDISLSDGRHVKLSDVASISDGFAQRRSAAFFNGKPVVAFEVVRTKGAGEIEIMNDVRKKIAELKVLHPHVTINESFNFVDPIIENYDGSMHLLYEGAFLAIVVVWFFLRDWRATLVSALALPLSIIPTFAIMYLMGFTINVVTLLSLSLVVGILVDDAIVEIENIMRHLSMGKTPMQAAMEAADEIGLAVVATTFTLIAVFLPTAFMTGVVGKFFAQFGWTAAISVFFSLVVARLLTPMMAAYLLKPVIHAHTEARWETWYLKLAHWSLKNRLRTTIATAVFFVVVLIGLTPLLPTGFTPPDDLSQTQVMLALPPGSTLSQTEAKVNQAESIVKRNKYVRNIYTTIGGGSSGANVMESAGVSDARNATLTISLVSREKRKSVSKQDIEKVFRHDLEELTGVRVKVGFAGATERYQIALTGEDGKSLIEHSLKVVREINSIPGIGNVTSSSSLMRPELVVRPDLAKAADLGVTSTAIAETLRVATLGDYDQSLAKLNLAQRQLPIVVKLSDEFRKDPQEILNLAVPGAHGPVLLNNFATVEMGGGPSQIDRYDRNQTVNIDVELNGMPMGDVESLIGELESLKNLPVGIKKAAIGDAESMSELFEGFTIAMGTGVLCIYIVLVLLFKDFVQPVTILAALILSVPGAIVALFLTHSALSMPAMIGMILLMGVATKNSILLVEYAITARNEWGFSRFEALIDASRKRARPIVMTTIAMGVGMLPIALGIGTDPSFRAPMAIVVIGGLITSTVLSLIVIPVLFTYVDDLRLVIMNRFTKKTASESVSSDTGTN